MQRHQIKKFFSARRDTIGFTSEEHKTKLDNLKRNGGQMQENPVWMVWVNWNRKHDIKKFWKQHNYTVKYGIVKEKFLIPINCWVPRLIMRKNVFFPVILRPKIDQGRAAVWF